MDIIKGSSVKVTCKIWKNWTGQVSTSEPANLTAGSVKLYAKIRPTDSDASALFTKISTLTDPLNGLCEIPIDAADTNGLSHYALCYEIVAKLATGSIIRNGVKPLNLKQNVLKTLP